MVYYKISFKAGGTFTYSPAILLRSYYTEGYMYCEFESITETEETWEEINKEKFEAGWQNPSTIIIDKQVVTDKSNQTAPDTISIHIPTSLQNGLKIQFSAPCNCTGIRKLIVQGQSFTQTYDLKNKLDDYVGSGGDFLKNTIVTVELNTVSNTATVVGNLINPNYKLIEETAAEVVSIRTEMKELFDGEQSVFGTGALGNVDYSEKFKWNTADYYGRYILQFQDFTLPEGVTMTPPENCNGLYIYCKGVCTINGTIDMRGKRLTLDSDNGISNFIKVGEQQYPLAVGGHTVKGGNGGYSGDFVNDKNAIVRYGAGGQAGNPTAGNINGGGTNNYGLAGIPFANGMTFSKMTDNDWRLIADDGMSTELGNNWPPKAKTGGVSAYRPATGAIVILAHEVVINGVINCEGMDGVPCVNKGEDGQLPKYYNMNTGAYMEEWRGKCGRGTDGSQAPTGGGCITIITKKLTNNGRLLTGGKALKCEGGAKGADIRKSDEGYTGIAAGGQAGQGGTFISQAGEIKIHIIKE